MKARTILPTDPAFPPSAVLAAAGLAAAGLATAVAIVFAAGTVADPPPAAGPGLCSPPSGGPGSVRVLAYEVVSREYLAGRLALAEAAAVFGWLNAQDPPLRLPPMTGPQLGQTPGPAGWTDGEQLALQVARWVKCVAETADPGRPAAVRAALAEEFRAGRPFRLPAVSGPGCEWLLAAAATGYEQVLAGGRWERPAVAGLRLIAPAGGGR